MRSINITSYDPDANKNNMDRLLNREHQKLDLWKKVKENQESNFQKQLQDFQKQIEVRRSRL